MKNIIFFLLSIFTTLIFIVSFPETSSACDCVKLSSPKEEFERSAIVFSGKVVEINEKQDGSGSKAVRFELSNTFKGHAQSQVVIRTGLSDANCGIKFEKGQEYLVYAYESTMYGAESLVSTICTRTNKLVYAQEDLKFLGKGKPLIKKENVSSNVDNGQQINMWIGIIVVILIASIFLMKKNKR